MELEQKYKFKLTTLLKEASDAYQQRCDDIFSDYEALLQKMKSDSSERK